MASKSCNFFWSERGKGNTYSENVNHCFCRDSLGIIFCCLVLRILKLAFFISLLCAENLSRSFIGFPSVVEKLLGWLGGREMIPMCIIRWWVGNELLFNILISQSVRKLSLSRCLPSSENTGECFCGNTGRESGFCMRVFQDSNCKRGMGERREVFPNQT